MTSKDDQNQSHGSRLEELALALKEAQLMLLKQSSRLESVDEEEEIDAAHELTKMRDKLAVITAERDQLQNRLLALERMQTETIALTADSDVAQKKPATSSSSWLEQGRSIGRSEISSIG